MRILLLLTSVFGLTGGVHTFNRALIKATDDLASDFGLEVTVFSLLDGDVPSQAAADYMSSGHTRYRGFKGNKTEFAAATLLAGWRADRVVFGHVNFSSLACGIPKPIKSLVVHGIDVWKPLPAIQKLGISCMRQVISVSGYTQEALVSFNGMPPVQFLLLPDTLDPFYSRTADKVRSAKELGLPEGHMMLTVTRLQVSEGYKRVDLVIKAMPAILKHVPGAFFVVVGAGDDRFRLKKLTQETGVADKVFFAGFVQDELLPSYYDACDLFVLPSLKEGFGIVFLEAMYHAKACIGARAGGIPEVVQDGETGLLAERDSVDSFVQCVVRLLSNGQEREAMGRRGKERLEREFSFEKFRSGLERVLC
jgi:glycosyltransferase involved in cell wall biosynthesis